MGRKRNEKFNKVYNNNIPEFINLHKSSKILTAYCLPAKNVNNHFILRLHAYLVLLIFWLLRVLKNNCIIFIFLNLYIYARLFIDRHFSTFS